MKSPGIDWLQQTMVVNLVSCVISCQQLTDSESTIGQLQLSAGAPESNRHDGHHVRLYITCLECHYNNPMATVPWVRLASPRAWLSNQCLDRQHVPLTYKPTTAYKDHKAQRTFWRRLPSRNHTHSCGNAGRTRCITCNPIRR